LQHENRYTEGNAKNRPNYDDAATIIEINRRPRIPYQSQNRYICCEKGSNAWCCQQL